MFLFAFANLFSHFNHHLLAELNVVLFLSFSSLTALQLNWMLNDDYEHNSLIKKSIALEIETRLNFSFELRLKKFNITNQKRFL